MASAKAADPPTIRLEKEEVGPIGTLLTRRELRIEGSAFIEDEARWYMGMPYPPVCSVFRKDYATPAKARSALRARLADHDPPWKQVDCEEGRARELAEMTIKRGLRKAERTAASEERRQPLPPALERWDAWWKALTPKWKAALREILQIERDPARADLRTIAGLRKLDLYEADVVDVKPLAELPRLESLDLYGTRVADLAPLAKLKKLRMLRVGNCSRVRDLTPLAGLRSLRTLYIDDTEVTDLSPLYRVSSLRSLVVSAWDEDEDWAREIAAFRKKRGSCSVTTAS